MSRDHITAHDPGEGSKYMSKQEANNKKKVRKRKKKNINGNEEDVNIDEAGGNLLLTGTKQTKEGECDVSRDDAEEKNKDQATEHEKIKIASQEETNNQTKTQVHNTENTYEIDHEEVQNNYLKLISGTSLEEEHNIEYEYELDPGQ